MFVFETRCEHFKGCRGRTAGAFSLLETLAVIALLVMLILAALGAITLLDRSSRRQAHYTTALVVAQGKLDELVAKSYHPPEAPFTNSYVERVPVTLSIDRNGTAVSSQGLVTTTVEKVANGHLATVVVSYTNYAQAAAVQLQTVINKLSGGQR